MRIPSHQMCHGIKLIKICETYGAYAVMHRSYAFQRESKNTKVNKKEKWSKKKQQRNEKINLPKLKYKYFKEDEIQR